MNRREFCRGAASATGALAISSHLLDALPADGVETIGIQLYSVRDIFAADPPGTLKQLAQIGYKEVELAGFGQHSIEEIKAAIQKAGLRAPSSHVPLENLRNNLSEVIANAKMLGNSYVVCPWLDQEMRSRDGYRQAAALLNQAGQVTRQSGITLAYHNHDFEFAVLGGTIGYDILLEETDPEVVKFEMDLYWIRKGGGDPLAYFEKWPNRFHLVHVKDMGRNGEMVNVGAGVIKWEAIFSKSSRAGIEHYFVEHDNPPSPIAFARASYDYLHALKW
ncbi:MAG TPA: sugar phosphate isomerase/epimerase family protein [Gemmatimonadales bacterium]|nr:sugar phosphate isomerase/epimerase family protein [Gemmatimonadales bacterium]